MVIPWNWSSSSSSSVLLTPKTEMLGEPVQQIKVFDDVFARQSEAPCRERGLHGTTEAPLPNLGCKNTLGVRCCLCQADERLEFVQQTGAL